MGLLDGIIGNVIGSVLSGNQTRSPLGAGLGGLGGGNARDANPLLQIALVLLQQNGGLEGILGKFREAGLNDQADSWVSTGANRGISPDQLEQALGSSTVSDIASQLGLSQEQTGSALSELLPEVINRLTPQGQVTAEGNDAIAEGLESLAKSVDK